MIFVLEGVGTAEERLASEFPVSPGELGRSTPTSSWHELGFSQEASSQPCGSLSQATSLSKVGAEVPWLAVCWRLIYVCIWTRLFSRLSR